MGVATAISLGLAAAGGIKQAIDASNAKAEADNAAQQEANKLARINEADKFKNLQVPTLGLELAQQNMQARQAQDLQGLQDIGAAGVLGGLTKLETQGRAEDLALSAQAQEMQYARNQAQAQNAQQIEQNRMQREAGLAQSRLAGAQAMGAQARMAEQAAYTGLAENAMNAAFTSEYFKGNKTPPAAAASVPAGTPQVSANSTGVAPTVAQQSYAQPAGTAPLNNQNNVSGWQTGVYAPKIATMPNITTDLSGLRAAQGDYEKWLTLGGQTGDPLNDMYQRKALLGY